MGRFSLWVMLALAVGACSRPQPPDTERPPEPQAEEGAGQATALREAIQTPLEKARAVEATVQDAAERREAAVEAAGG